MAEQKERIVVVQFSVVEASADARIKLHALRNIMHRMLNTAISEWHRADKKPSSRDPSKETLSQASVTAAVKTVLENERRYWSEQIPKLAAAEAKLRVQLGRAKARNQPAVELEKDHRDVTRQLEKAECKAVLTVPSVITDPVVSFTFRKYVEYMKAAFRGTRSSPTFREGQPIRWRDNSWQIAATEKKGVYSLTVPIFGEGRAIERATLTIIPDGPSMYGWAKRMTDNEEIEAGTVKQCDARLTYSDDKKQWFAKITARFSYTPRKAGSQIATMRRGAHNAFVLAFEDGWCQEITGADVIAFKAKIKVRKESISRHLRSLELGKGARGHGMKRRFAALLRIDDAEARFVDTRCKTWAAQIASLLGNRGVGKLIVANTDAKEFIDSIDNEVLQAWLRNFPFAKALDCLKRACEYKGITIEEVPVHFNTRRCPAPDCGHIHASRQDGVFTCEVCGFKRPSDQILARNMLKDVVGDAPVKKSEATRKTLQKAVQKLRS